MLLSLTYISYALSLSVHAVAAKPVRSRETTPFQIEGFGASGYPYKTPTGYLFWCGHHPSLPINRYRASANMNNRVEHNITVRPDESDTWCYAWQRTHTTDMSIQTITTVPCQEDNTITWSFVKAIGGFNFSVAWQYTGHAQLAGSAWIPDHEIQWITENNNAVQKYVGPSSFSVATREVAIGM